MTLQLFVVAGPDKDRAFPIQIGPDLMIGRSPQAYYHVTDPSICATTARSSAKATR